MNIPTRLRGSIRSFSFLKEVQAPDLIGFERVDPPQQKTNLLEYIESISRW